MGTDRKRRIHAILILIVFAAIAPTLRWMPFSGGSENLVVGTVLEMRNGGPWIIPNLKGGARTNKPPLTAWVTAAAVQPSTVAGLTDPATRDAAYVRLAWEVRWPALLASCLMLLVIFELGLVLGDVKVGMAAAVIAACSVLFLRFCRSATTDVYLALFVTATNLFFARAIFYGERWRGAILGGISLGLALMSKGPPALVQTIPPLVALLPFARWNVKRATGPAVVATVVTLAIALPWPVHVLMQLRGVLDVWFAESVEGGTQGYGRDPLYAYLSIFGLMMPFLAALVVGMAVSLRKPRDMRKVFAFLLAFAPIVVMTCFKEKNERYLLPMLGPCAIVAAYGLMTRDRIMMALQWLTVAVIAVGAPIGAFVAKDVDGQHWLTIQQLIVFEAIAIVVLFIGYFRNSFLGTTLVVMMLAQAIFIYGYSRSSGGVSEMKTLADAIFQYAPRGAVVNNYRKKVPIDMEIYLDRVVRRTTDPANSQATVIVSWRTRDEAIPPELASWKKIGSTQRGVDKDFWEAFLRP